MRGVGWAQAALRAASGLLRPLDTQSQVRSAGRDRFLYRPAGGASPLPRRGREGPWLERTWDSPGTQEPGPMRGTVSTWLCSFGLGGSSSLRGRNSNRNRKDCGLTPVRTSQQASPWA